MTQSISISETSDDSILKFESDNFIVQHKSYEFKNIEDAQNSELAQQLFHLPFVKTVYIAQNFVAVQKYNIVEWQDVQNELADKISTYLNSGQAVVNDKLSKNKKIPVTVYAESTPNPNVMKFVANKKLVLQPMEFKSIDDTADVELVQKLFHFPFVKEVYMDENFISIQKYDMAEWDDITMELREFIRKYLEEHAEVVKPKTVQSSTTDKEVTNTPVSEKELSGISLQISQILEEYVKPAVASDGGNIIFQSYDEDTQAVHVVLQGACSGCPSSTMTLKNGIENLLKDMLPEKVNEVVAING